MFSKINMKWLAGIFGLLLVLALVVSLRNKSTSVKSKNRTFSSELIDFDSAKVSQISIYPKFGGEMIQLQKSEDKWKIATEGKSHNADAGAIEQMLKSLLDLRATRIAANSKDRWAKFEVTDSMATRVVVKVGKKEAADIYLGKFSYQPPKQQNLYAQYGQQQGTMTSYVRLAGDKEVFATDGMIAMSFNRMAKDFRDRTLIDSDQNSWNRISVNSPSGSYTMNKQGNNWLIDGLVPDSLTMVNYLRSLSRLSSGDFVEEGYAFSETPAYELSIEGENMTAPIKIKAFPSDTIHVHVLTSTQNEGSWFSAGKTGLLDKLIKNKDHFLPVKEEELK